VSRTFHGRDVFAPVAAPRRAPLDAFGRITDPVRLAPPAPVDGDLVGRVMFVDRFGNALTNLTAEPRTHSPACQALVRVGSRACAGWRAPTATRRSHAGRDHRFERPPRDRAGRRNAATLSASAKATRSSFRRGKAVPRGKWPKHEAPASSAGLRFASRRYGRPRFVGGSPPGT
jgi:hypothetical protein